MKLLKYLIIIPCILTFSIAFCQEHTIRFIPTDSVSTLRKQTAYSLFQTFLFQEKERVQDSIILATWQSKYTNQVIYTAKVEAVKNECLTVASELKKDNAKLKRSLKFSKGLNKVLIGVSMALVILKF